MRAEVRLEQVEWLRPVVVGTEGLDLHVELFAEEAGRTGYEIYSGGEDEERVIHSQGWAVVEPLGAVAEVSAMSLLPMCCCGNAAGAAGVAASAGGSRCGAVLWAALDRAVRRREWAREVEAEVVRAVASALCRDCRRRERV